MSASKIFYSPSRSNISNVQAYGGERAFSLSRAKISQLSEKLSNLQHQINEDQAFKKETFENKVKILEEKVTKQTSGDDSKFRLLKEQLQNVEEGVQNENIIREVFKNQAKDGEEKLRSKDLKGLEVFLNRELQQEKVNFVQFIHFGIVGRESSLNFLEAQTKNSQIFFIFILQIYI